MNTSTSRISAAKFGGGILREQNGLTVSQSYQRAANLSREFGYGLVVVSAVNGVTNKLIKACDLALKKSSNGASYKNEFEKVKSLHESIHDSPGVTFLHNKLYSALGNAYNGRVSPEESSAIIQSFGEQISAQIFSEISGFELIEPAHIGLVSSSESFLNATVSITNGSCPDPHYQYIMGGYYARDSNGKIHLTGRGGSDYIAAMASAAMGAQSLDLWKDVDGIMTADPRIVSNTHLREEVGFHEASVLANYGMNILHALAPEAVRGRGISFNVRNFYAPEATGTRIVENKTQNGFTIAHKKDISLIDVSAIEMANMYGYASEVFSRMSQNSISVDIISTSQISISFTVSRSNGPQAHQILSQSGIGTTSIIEDASLMTIVADNMNFVNLSSNTFAAISSAGQSNVHAISKGSYLGELNIVLNEDLLQPVLQSVHDRLLAV